MNYAAGTALLKLDIMGKVSDAPHVLDVLKQNGIDLMRAGE
jgi:hypothetical protein